MLMNVAGGCQHGGVGSPRYVFLVYAKNVLEQLLENGWNLVIPINTLYRRPANFYEAKNH